MKHGFMKKADAINTIEAHDGPIFVKVQLNANHESAAMVQITKASAIKAISGLGDHKAVKLWRNGDCLNLGV